MSDVRVWQWWDALVTRLSTARMAQLTGGAGRVYKVTDLRGDPEGAEDQVWGRVVVVQTNTLWPRPFVPGETRKLAWLVRCEIHAPQDEAGFDPGRTLDAMHAEAFAQLQGWVPAVDTMRDAFVAVPVYRFDEPQSLPLWDEGGGVHYTSSEYRTELAPRS